MTRSTVLGGAAIGFLLSMAASTPAVAGATQVVPWQDSGSVVHAVGEVDWCSPDVVDFEIIQRWEARGIDRISTHGDGLIHFAGTHQSVDTYSANGIDVVIASTGRSRDQRIAYNGDGTLTIRFTNSSTTTASIDGVPLFHDAELVDGAVVIDHGGTPTDPGDDIFLGTTGGVVSHGRYDANDRDFCEDLATYLGS
jgi:hypothetical protein